MNITPLSATTYNKTIFSNVSRGTDPALMIPADTDSDADNIPDDWEINNGTLPLTNDINTDIDGDGFTSWDEYVFGTHPNQASSFFKITMEDVSEGFDLSFPTISGRSYRVLRTPDLTVNFAELVTILGDDSTATVRDTLGTNTAFYRIEALLDD
ncbi:MAG: hypothetical protein NWT02_05290 [Opitutales bacterium]|nr:hypothetical protein [Opitutales bacterium]MDP4643137.1 hypothetical protein [Opitutales bacterium]MDP4777122.1 hypothetical protein [Opitutales bacterium]MDP4883307.1 hypothetical protein [Opitutales bacterium]MDP5079726.1 hypothetical protein [Opitutales bacterium]